MTEDTALSWGFFASKRVAKAASGYTIFQVSDRQKSISMTRLLAVVC